MSELPAPKKKKYVPPKVTPLGTVAQLTRTGGSVPIADNVTTLTKTGA